MKKFRKAISLIIIMVMLIASLIPAMTANADTATSVRNRKIVSIVYDDSGSMRDNKWEFTSYAIQCFAAMLNEEDSLAITYMSSYRSGWTTIDLTNRQAAVDSIRNHSDSGATPVSSIDTAFDALVDVGDTNPNSQYWLIILTDGDMYDDNNSNQSPCDVKIKDYADKKLPNGTKANIIYMPICDVGGTFTFNFPQKNVTTKAARTADEVISVISEIACDISGRYEVAKSDIKQIDGKTLQVNTDLPLTRMGLLLQRSSATVVKIEGLEGNELSLDYTVSAEHPNSFPDAISDEDKADLRGNISLYSNKSSNISAGTYTIHFSEDISIDDVVVMFEPAFDFRIEVSSNGVVIDDLTTLLAHQKVDIEAVLYEMGTNDRILPSMLPSGAEKSIEMSEDDSVVLSDSSLKLENVSLNAVETYVEAELDIAGFFTVRDSIIFTPKSVDLSDLAADLDYDGSTRRKDKDGNPDAENVIYITDLDDNGTGIKFTLSIDGEPIDKSTATSLLDEIEKNLDTDFANFDLKVNNDGTVTVVPSGIKMPYIFYWLKHRGNQEISLSLDEYTADGTLCFKMGDWKKAIIDLVVLILLVWAIIRTILWWTVKKHFGLGTVEVKVSFDNGETPQTFPLNNDHLNFFTGGDLLNWFGLKGMRKRLDGCPYVIRTTRNGYRLEGVKDCHVSKEANVSTRDPICNENYYNFRNRVSVLSGNKTYTIYIKKQKK